MKKGIIIIALFQCVSLYAQKTMPGGVKGAAVWEITQAAKTGNTKWESRLPGNFDSTLAVEGRIKTINNNPALLFDGGSNSINSTLYLGRLTSFSMFTVCQATDTLRERAIISLENDTTAEMVLTNRRLANLDLYRYLSYNTGFQLHPKIFTYIQNKPKEQGLLTRSLQLGRPPRIQQLPVSAFNGVVPEIILFDRVLSPPERQKVETYLALKYGIPLNQAFPASYLNSKGEIIWDAEKNATFNQNIAGIGRDDLSGLNQLISECVLTPEVMKIGVTGELQNNSFLVWGDNGRPLRFDEETGLRKLQREWKISAFNSGGTTVGIEANEMSLNEINPLHDGEIYWMMIDRSGTGRYPFGQTEYIKCLPFSSPQRFFRFSSVDIDTDNSGDDVFTFLSAPPFFTRNVVQPPSCLLPQSGIILCEIAGGMPPFRIVLKGLSNSAFHTSAIVESRNHIFKGIDQGSYLLLATDAGNRVFSEKLWISNSNPRESTISRYYDLIQGEPFVLDASEGIPRLNYIYSWTLPDGSISDRAEIFVDRPGNYMLSVTDENNCNSIREINIRETGGSVINGVQLFPNPSGGNFTIRIRLDHVADVNLVISDMSGKILKQILLQKSDFYIYNDVIHQPGIYIITLSSSYEEESLRLVVQ